MPRALCSRLPRGCSTQIVEIEGDDKVWEIDMNRTYKLGSQEWYLQQRRKDKEDSGEIKVVLTDRSDELDAMEVRFRFPPPVLRAIQVRDR